MRIMITITHVCTLEKDISVKAICHKKVQELTSGLLCCFQVARNEYIGKIASLTDNDGKVSLNLKIARQDQDYDVSILRSLLPYQYSDKKELPLLLEEKADREIAKEVHLLLYTLSQKTGKKPEEILWEHTEFKPGAGRRDLRFVSEKQMFVVRDQMKQRLSEGQTETSPQEAYGN